MIFDLLRDVILTNMGPLKHAPKNWQKSNCRLCMTQGHGKEHENR